MRQGKAHRIESIEQPDLIIDCADDPKATLDSVNELLSEKGIPFEFIEHRTDSSWYAFSLVPKK